MNQTWVLIGAVLPISEVFPVLGSRNQGSATAQGGCSHRGVDDPAAGRVLRAACRNREAHDAGLGSIW